MHIQEMPRFCVPGIGPILDERRNLIRGHVVSDDRRLRITGADIECEQDHLVAGKDFRPTQNVVLRQRVVGDELLGLASRSGHDPGFSIVESAEYKPIVAQTGVAGGADCFANDHARPAPDRNSVERATRRESEPLPVGGEAGLAGADCAAHGNRLVAVATTEINLVLIVLVASGKSDRCAVGGNRQGGKEGGEIRGAMGDVDRIILDNRLRRVVEQRHHAHREQD